MREWVKKRGGLWEEGALQQKMKEGGNVGVGEDG